METPRSVLAVIRKGDFVISLDLQDPYLQILRFPSFGKFLCFVSRKITYQFRAFCFGLATAPQVFTSVFQLISEWTHKRGICLWQYLDDWLILVPTAEQARRNRDLVLKMCKTMGICITYKKLDLIPTQNIRYLSMMLNTQKSKAFTSEERIDKFLNILNSCLSNLLQLKKNWQILIGNLVFLEKLVPRAEPTYVPYNGI